ncbi:MAG: NnrU family protein [Chromatocurvus sp.]
MTLMIIGLLIFFGTHSLNIFAPDWREKQLQQRGTIPFKVVYALVSIGGLWLAIVGYGEMRMTAVPLWNPPVGLRHLVALLMLPSFILLAAAYIPANHLKARLGHPMLMAVKIWALAHLLVNGRLGDIIFFGAFLAWAVVLYIRLKKQDRARGTVYPAGSMLGTVSSIVVGTVLYVVFALYLHIYVAGVSAIGTM